MNDAAEFTLMLLLSLLGVVLIAVVGEVLVPGSWACFPDYCL